MATTSVGRMVRWARKRAGMTQHDLARAAGMPQGSIARIERGTVVPRTGTLVAILEASGHELIVQPRIRIGDKARTEILNRLVLDVPQRTWRALGTAATDRRTSPTFALRRLRLHGVPFVLIGDLAEVAHGAPMTLGRTIEVCLSHTDVAHERMAKARPEIGAFDVRIEATTAAGDDYDVLVRTASRVLVDTALLVHVASLDDLMRVRRARGSAEDLQAEAVLREIGALQVGEA